MSDVKLPGRLGNPDMTFEEDPRADPRIAAAFGLMALAEGVESIGPDAGYEEALDYAAAFESVGELAHPAMMETMPTFDDVCEQKVFDLYVDFFHLRKNEKKGRALYPPTQDSKSASKEEEGTKDTFAYQMFSYIL